MLQLWRSGHPEATLEAVREMRAVLAFNLPYQLNAMRESGIIPERTPASTAPLPPAAAARGGEQKAQLAMSKHARSGVQARPNVSLVLPAGTSVHTSSAPTQGTGSGVQPARPVALSQASKVREYPARTDGRQVGVDSDVRPEAAPGTRDEAEFLDKLLQIRDQVVTGEHPRIHLPATVQSAVVGKRKQEPKPAEEERDMKRKK